MRTWQADCTAHLKRTFDSNSLWKNYLNTSDNLDEQEARLHLAVCIEPYLSYILDGKKTVESRFSSVKCSPFQKVQKDDLILLKRAAGPVVGLCRVDAVWFYELDPSTFQKIRQKFSGAICPDGPDFWTSRQHASFATLISISNVQRLPPFSVGKRDRRGWVTFPLSTSGKQQWPYS